MSDRTNSAADRLVARSYPLTMPLHALTLALAFTATGCGEFATPPQRVTVSALFDSGTGARLTDGNNELVLTSLVLAPLVGFGARDDDGVEAEGERDARVRIVGALDPTGARSPLGALDAERGAHGALDVRLRPLDDKDVNDVRAAEGGFAELLTNDGAWALVDGTFNGQPFSLRARTEFDDTLPFDGGPLTVRLGAAANVTLRFDGAQWFRGPDGSLLNPVVAQELELTASIARSVSAQRDADEDGRDDGR